MTWGAIFASAYVLWVIAGLIWLLPRKLAVIRRLGNLSSDELILRAKSGDMEVQSLRKRTWWFCCVGLVMLLPLSLLKSLLQ